MGESPIRQVKSSYTCGQRNKAAGGVDGMYNPVADKSQTLELQFDRQTDRLTVVPEILRSRYSAQGDRRAWPLLDTLAIAEESGDLSQSLIKSASCRRMLHENVLICLRYFEVCPAEHIKRPLIRDHGHWLKDFLTPKQLWHQQQIMSI